ncbi:MAG: hypothetical protein ACPGLY_11565 [Rubripirellula sp.]
MKFRIGTAVFLSSLVCLLIADEPQTVSSDQSQRSVLRKDPQPLPPEIQKFNGMLVGRLSAKDIERGTFVVNIDAVSRVWRNSRAINPQLLVGMAVEVGNVSGKWLDVLVTTRIGETIEFECQHDGDGLRFPGELLRKVPPYKPENYPRLPEQFRGFQGAVVADIIRKDADSFEMLVKVGEVTDVWSGNKAKEPQSIQGRSLLLAGFWNRREQYHSLKPGDRIATGMHHISRQSDHVTVHEFVRKQASSSEGKMERMSDVRKPSPIEKEKPGRGVEMSSGVKGFRGMLVGRLVKKDNERGTFTITVDAVTRVWKNNQSRDPKSLIGQNVDAVGTPAKMLDTLIVARLGETIEFGALHDGVDQLRVGEILRKVSPVKPGDFPVLPDASRGIAGMVIAKVVKKDQQMWGLVVEIQGIQKLFAKNRAKNAQALTGKQVTLSGFWNRKEAYQKLQVGDVFRCGVDHPQLLSDSLNVIESVQKIDDSSNSQKAAPSIIGD